MNTAEELAEAINFYDNIGDQKIAKSQVGLCLRAIGLVPTESDIHKLTSSFPDEYRIGVEEMVPIAREVAKAGNDKIDLSLCLAPFDRESTGQITVPELRHMLQNCGGKLTPKEVDLLLAGIDTADGKVSIPIFVKQITSL